MCKQMVVHARDKWLKRVEQYFNEQFNGHWMPSHDIDHHRRVWNNACELVKHLPVIDSDFYEKLLLACYFHDLGLIIDRGEQHGSASRQFCENFLDKHKKDIGFSISDLYEAIEYHDDKEYKHSIGHNLVYTILCIADDLDAFGAIGAYRYIEIYRQREMEVKDISGKVLINAAARYMNIRQQMNVFGIQNICFQNEYNTLVKIFDEYSFEVPPESLVNWIDKNVILLKRDPIPYLNNMATSQLVPNERIAYFLDNFKIYEPQFRH